MSSEEPDTLRATVKDIDRLTVTLAEAFEKDPVFEWLLPDDASRQVRLQRFFGIELRQLVIPLGCVWTSSDLVGAALSLPPGAWSTPYRVAVSQGRVFGIHLPKAAGLAAQMEGCHLREPHYYFPYIGVAPAVQGQGLGSKLMRPTLERCDEEGIPAYLEATSERNISLYERLGFEARGQLRFGGSPPLVRMVRVPHAYELTSAASESKPGRQHR